jgi:hypothetical protein
MSSRSVEIKPYVTILLSKYKNLLNFVPDNMKPTFETKLAKAIQKTDLEAGVRDPDVPKSKTLLNYTPANMASTGLGPLTQKRKRKNCVLTPGNSGSKEKAKNRLKRTALTEKKKTKKPHKPPIKEGNL